MKKIFFYIIIPTLLYGCSTNDDVLNPTQVNETYFPAVSEEYGKAVAGKLREMVTGLNEMGVDYSNADNSPEFKQRFYGDVDKAVSSDLLRSTNSITHSQMSPDVLIEKISNLTKIQIEFIERIIKECGESTSYEDFSKRLITINKDISVSVPEIQQERLFNVTSVLYYGMNEIQNLEKQGQMLLTPNNAVIPIRLKSGNESGGGWGASCRKFLATVWVIAVGEPTPAGEIVASVITVVVGGILLYEVITCSKPLSVNECIEKYVDCVQYTSGYGCDTCLHRCRSSGYWDC